jgi:cyclic pyranopterin phosphate synthase
VKLIDNLGRNIDYLRLSVTDLCNMRCSYCMPESGVAKLSHCDILSYEQLLTIAQHAVAMGIEKIRITGGEPLVRKGLVEFLGKLSRVHGLKQLVLTTNGLLLEKMALDLKRAGVQRLNVSLDSLRPEVFSRITRRGDLKQVQAGIAAAEKAGFPLKINMVVMRGVNDSELVDFAALSLERSYSVRFIEYMPVIKDDNWQSLVLPGEEILSRLAKHYSFSPVVSGRSSGPAREFKIAGARGTIGVITPLSGHFCHDCNRIRVSASGKVRSCLFAKEEFDLKPVLSTGDSALIQGVLLSLIMSKPANHGMTQTSSSHAPFAMSQVGG